MLYFECVRLFFLQLHFFLRNDINKNLHTHTQNMQTGDNMRTCNKRGPTRSIVIVSFGGTPYEQLDLTVDETNFTQAFCRISRQS